MWQYFVNIPFSYLCLEFLFLRLKLTLMSKNTSFFVFVQTFLMMNWNFGFSAKHFVPNEERESETNVTLSGLPVKEQTEIIGN